MPFAVMVRNSSYTESSPASSFLLCFPQTTINIIIEEVTVVILGDHLSIYVPPVITNRPKRFDII